jgi:protein-export membrane protein SecD
VTWRNVFASAIGLAILYLGYALFYPLSKGQSPLNFGLDLAGGVIVSYRPDFSNTVEAYKSKSNAELLALSKDILSTRLSRKLKAVPDIYIRGDDQIIVSIPSVENYQQVLELVGRTFRLTMRLVLQESKDPIPGPNVYRYEGKYLKVDQPLFSGDMLDESRIHAQPGNPQAAEPEGRSPYVDFGFRRPYDDQFRTFTRQHVSQRLAFMLDDSVVYAGRITTEIDEGASMTGGFTIDEARDTAMLLRSGTLPVALQLVGLSGIGPSLGEEVRAKGETVVLLSLFLIFLLMIVVYAHRVWFLVAGTVSLVSLLFFIAGAAAAFHFTLDTAAIAGIILSVAMGVDAFIIIFESLEPKLKHFNSLELSHVGHTVVDVIYSFRHQGFVLLHPNISIVLVVVLLLQSDRLSSFAIFMCLGIGASILTIWVTRWTLLQTATLAPNTGPDFVSWIRNVKPGLFRIRKPYLAAFAVLAIAYLVICLRSSGTLGMTLGADFTAGAQAICGTADERGLQTAIRGIEAAHPQYSVRYQRMDPGQTANRYLLNISIPTTPNSPALRENRSIAAFGDPVDHPDIGAPVPGPSNSANKGPAGSGALAPADLIQILQANHVRLLSFDSIDSKISASRLFRSLTLLPLSCAILLFYFVVVEPRITSAFSRERSPLMLTAVGRALVAIGIVLSAVHDIIVMLFVCAVFHMELTLSVFAALLTIVGYSVMDSVVIWNYVRTRAEKHVTHTEAFDPVALVSDGIDATFSRVVLTGLSALIPALAILAVNLSSLHDFALLIVVGTVSGTLSSVFVVGPFAVKALTYSIRPKFTVDSLSTGHGTVRQEVDRRMAVID